MSRVDEDDEATRSLYPTNTCFDDAMEYIEFRLTEDPSLVHDERLILTHVLAEVLEPGPHQGEIITHAFCVENGECVDMWILNGERVAAFRTPSEMAQSLRIIESTRYNLKQVHQENVRSGTYGPWEQKYLDHVRNRESRDKATSEKTLIDEDHPIR